jgi:hypothetical protein
MRKIPPWPTKPCKPCMGPFNTSCEYDWRCRNVFLLLQELLDERDRYKKIVGNSKVVQNLMEVTDLLEKELARYKKAIEGIRDSAEGPIQVWAEKLLGEK